MGLIYFYFYLWQQILNVTIVLRNYMSQMKKVSDQNSEHICDGYGFVFTVHYCRTT